MNAQYILPTSEPNSGGGVQPVAAEESHNVVVSDVIAEPPTQNGSSENHTEANNHVAHVTSPKTPTEEVPAAESTTVDTSESKKSKRKEKKSTTSPQEDEDMRKFITQLRQRGYSDKIIEKKIGAAIPEDMSEEVKPWKDEEDKTTQAEEGDSVSLLGKKITWNTDDKVDDSFNSAISDAQTSTQSSSIVSNPTAPRPWKPKYTLKSHLDSVRSVAFHPTDSYLMSGSEDGTVKVWNAASLSKTRANDPIQTLRGHTSAVNTVKCGKRNCFSAGADETIIVWNMPSIDHDPYTNYGYATPFLKKSLRGHSDVIWSLSLNETNHTLLSASADDTVMLWDYEASSDNLLKTYSLSKFGTPTCVSFLPNDETKFVVSFTNSKLAVFDVNTGASIWVSDLLGEESKTDYLIYQVACHPNVPLFITAHEDKKIRYYDASSGKIVNEMVGHKEAVSSVAFDPSGLYFASAGHDSSLRVWDVSTKRCIQELPGHRKKYDEAINGVAYHPTSALMATCGADSMVKVYTV